MHDALHLVLVLGFDGDAVAVSAHGNDTVLQVGSQRHIYHLVELLVDPAAGLADLPADSSKAGTGLVGDVLFGENAAVDLFGQALQRIETVEKVEEDVVLGPDLLTISEGGDASSAGLGRSVFLHAGHIVQKRGQMKELRRRQRTSDGQGSEGIAEVSVGAEINISLPDQELERRVRLLLRQPDVRQVVHGPQISAERLGGGGIGVFRQLVDYFIIFNDAKYFFIHGTTNLLIG